MEKRYFQSNFRAYVAKGCRDGCELWAMSLTDNEDVYLGRLRNGSIERVDDFYNLPWDVFKGAERLFMLADLSWDSFVLDYKELRNVEWMHMTKRTGPLPDIKMIRTVKKYRKAGLSFRKIAKALDKDHKSVFRWSLYNLSTLRGLR